MKKVLGRVIGGGIAGRRDVWEQRVLNKMRVGD